MSDVKRFSFLSLLLRAGICSEGIKEISTRVNGKEKRKRKERARSKSKKKKRGREKRTKKVGEEKVRQLERRRRKK